MTLIKAMFIGATMLVGATVAANAQWQYATPPQYASNPYDQYQPYPSNLVPAAPQSWSYDPYTSGLGPCPQRGPGDPPCKETMQPSYGQPSYWPGR